MRVINLSSHRRKRAKEQATDLQQPTTQDVDRALAHLRRASACLDRASAVVAADKGSAESVAHLQTGTTRLIERANLAKPRPPLKVGRRLTVVATKKAKQ